MKASGTRILGIVGSRMTRITILGLLLLVGCAADDHDTVSDDDIADDDSADDDDIAPDDDSAGDDDTTPPNNPPTMPTIEIRPEIPVTGDDLLCFITEMSTDPDGDSVSYQYLWTNNGVTTAYDGDTMPASFTEYEHEYTCMVTPTDGQDHGPTAVASATVFPSTWDAAYFIFDIRIDATGGVTGGPATVDWTIDTTDEQLNTMCSSVLRFEADYTYGLNQGDDLWGNLDMVLTFTSVQELSNNCPLEIKSYESDPLADWLWVLYPLAFVSCDQVDADLSLAETVAGVDVWGFIPGTDGTFADHCSTVGNYYQATLGTGPIDGVWLWPREVGFWGEEAGNFNYFVPPDDSNVPSWLVNGSLMADVANANEPAEGLEGAYQIANFWGLYIGSF